MATSEEKTTQLIKEIVIYTKMHGNLPKKGVLSSDGRDMGKALTEYRSGKRSLTKGQLELLALLDSFESIAEKNIQKLEENYNEHGYLSLSKENDSQLQQALYNFRNGKTPITSSQRNRLEKIGAFSTVTELMISSIEEFYEKYKVLPKIGDTNIRNKDMGIAIANYKQGKLALTLGQKMRLERLGLSLSKAKIKEEKGFSVKIIPEKKDTLSDKIMSLRTKKEQTQREGYSITKIIQEIFNYIQMYRIFPPLRTLSESGKDMNQFLLDYRNGKLTLTDEQKNSLFYLEQLLSETEWQIREIEMYYSSYNCMPTLATGSNNYKLVKIISDIKSGKIPITKSQKQRLDAIGVFLTSTEKKVSSIEKFYEEHHRLPKRGELDYNYMDIGRIASDFRNGNRILTLAQKMRLERLGLSLEKAKIKEEKPLNIRIIPENPFETEIIALNEEKRNLIEQEVNQKNKAV